MGFFGWRGRNARATSANVADEIELWWQGDGEYGYEIVGTSHYQEALRTICGGLNKNGHNLKRTAYLVHDANNKYDKRAIAVLVEGRLIGHLSKRDAPDYYDYLAKHELFKANIRSPAQIVGGWDRGPEHTGLFGVRLDLTLPLTLEKRDASAEREARTRRVEKALSVTVTFEKDTSIAIAAMLDQGDAVATPEHAVTAIVEDWLVSRGLLARPTRG